MSPDSSHEAEEYSIEEAMRSENGVLHIGSTRAVVMTLPAYIFMMRVLHEHAPHAIKYAFYDMGYRVGQELMNTLAGAAAEPEKSFRYLVETYRQSGYGDMQVVSFDMSKPEARLAGTKLFETDVARNSEVYRTPLCGPLQPRYVRRILVEPAESRGDLRGDRLRVLRRPALRVRGAALPEVVPSPVAATVWR